MRRLSKRTSVTIFIAALAALAVAPAAHATLSLTPSIDFLTDPIAVGSTGSGTISFTNDSSALEPSAFIERIAFDPSCKDAGSPPPCANPDTGVFSISDGTGAPGTACSGTSFTPVPGTAPYVGALQFTPSPPLSMLVNQTCLINFAYTALRVPSFDSQPGEPGVNTDQDVVVRADSGGGPVQFGPGTGDTGVSPAPTKAPLPVVTATATGQRDAALAKCKKKHGKKRKKCKKKANLLPL